MFQDEEYDSDTSDEDFVPEGAESDDEDVSDVPENDPEDNNDQDDDSNKKGKKKKSKTKKGNLKKVNPLLAGVQSTRDDSEDVVEEEEVPDESKDKAKVDDLWADFLADTEEKPTPPPKPKTNSWASLLGGKKSCTSSTPPPDSLNKDSDAKSMNKKAAKSTKIAIKPDTVKITKVFEFAGEEIRVEQEVAPDSAEARQAEARERLEASNKAEENGGNSSKLPGSMKRPSGLADILGMIDSKKQKLSTLEKTRLDWNKYKSNEGIVDELESHKKSKDGYLEKKEFLERADLRQFEIERSMRMGVKRSSR